MTCTRAGKLVMVLALGIVLATAVPAAASRGSAAGTLQVHAGLNTKWQTVACPAGTPSPPAFCDAIQGQGGVPGLGETTESYTYVVDSATAPTTSVHFAAVITVAGKGEIDASAVTHSPVCSCNTPTAAFDFTVTGGTGAYAGAQGGGTVVVGTRRAIWSGALTVPGYTFDTTPPVFSGASAKFVRALKGKRAVRVRYAVSARDDVDGLLPATCKPASGSSFRIGRTNVICKATDSSANTATTRFIITVKR
jgi:HYR domain